jgi:hypothetical protein
VNFFCFDHASVSPNCFSGLGTCQSFHMGEATMLFDKEFQRTVEYNVVGGGHFFGTFNTGWLLYPLKLEGRVCTQQ